MNNLTIKKHIILITLAVISAIFVIFGIGCFSYMAKAANSGASAEDLRIISDTALSSVDEFEEEDGVELVFFAVSDSGKFNEGDYQIHGVLIPSTKSISIDNISNGDNSIRLFTSSLSGSTIEYWFFFFIPRKNFSVNYRCIVYVTDTNNNIILANYDEPEIDHSVYETAKKERENPDKMLNDYIRQDYDNLISAIESDRKIQEDKDRQDTIDSTIQDIKDYGQKFIEDPYFQKIIAVFGGVFFVVLFFSFLSVLMGLRK